MARARRPLTRTVIATGAAAALLGTSAAALDRPEPAETKKPGRREPATGLTVRQLAGQRVIYGWHGVRRPSGLLRRIRRGEAAGVILFTRNIRTRRGLARTVRRLQSIPRPHGLRAPLLVMIDQEGGLVRRLSGAPRRSAAVVGRTGSVRVAYRAGRAAARNLRSVGVNVNLAPVVDVGRPGSFQRRTARTYGGRPGRVGAMGAAVARGLRAGGVAATLKHFPGLGLPRENEDHVVQRVGLSRGQLRRVDEAPFGTGVRAGAQLVMTGTARYPALSSRPALLSRAVSTRELRGYVGFRGVSITDDLTARGLVPYGSPPRLGVQAARAGNDLLLFGGGYETAHAGLEALVRATRAGSVRERDARRSVERVLALRGSLP